MNIEGFKIKKLSTVDDIVTNWDFLREGLERMNQLTKTHPITAEVFLKVVLEAVSRGEPRGLVFMATSKNDKELLYVVLLDVTTQFTKRVALCYACYSNGKSKTVSKFALEYAKQWAKGVGYEEMQASSPRINGSAFALFEKHWGFRRMALTFYSPL